jgi:hypothetical protein
MKAKSTLNDQLKKLGLRVRPRTVAPADPEKPGHVAFDDRGNAVYEWNRPDLAEDSEEAERARRQALTYANLSLVEEEPAPNAPIRNNIKGARIGYNPYESGLLSKRATGKKRDLRELSKWIETKKKLEEGTGD